MTRIFFFPHSYHLLYPSLIPGIVHVNKRLSEIKAQLERGEEVKGGLLTHMLITREMSVEEIYANVTEMLLAGVDTVRVCLCFDKHCAEKGSMYVKSCRCVCLHLCVCVSVRVSVEFQRLCFWRHVHACEAVPASGQSSVSGGLQFPTDKLVLTQI